MNVVPMPKLKAFLDDSLEVSFTVERWTTLKYVRDQLRILCDNKINEDADKWISPSQATIPHEVFLDIIAPAFPEKSSSQDKMALLKRSRWVVNANRGATFAKLGLPCHSSNRKMASWISSSDWLEKRQWSHDFVSPWF